MANDIRILYEDQDILVCHKRAGMATEGATAGRIDLVSAARNYLARKERMDVKGRRRNLPPYVATVNRLDAPVEGVLVLAKNKNAASDLARQIKDRSTDKYYYALCYGVPFEEKGRLIDNLVRRADTGLAMAVTDKEKASIAGNVMTLQTGEKVGLISGDAKKAELGYEVIARTDKTALLRIHLLTGRFHQIRVQLSKRGFPILGDDKYGTKESCDYAKDAAVKDICLVSYSFSFKHPGTKKRVTYEIVPDNIQIKELLDRN